MDYITRNEFEALKEEVQQLKEQRTEEIKAVRVEVASKDVLDSVESLKQELYTISNTWLNTLQEHYNEHTARFERIETTMSGLATKDDLAGMEERFKDLLIKHLRPGGNGH